jgi:hypothetical protein
MRTFCLPSIAPLPKGAPREVHFSRDIVNFVNFTSPTGSSRPPEAAFQGFLSPSPFV